MAPSSSSFPRSKDVPFPYASPYPVQSALMDTILQSLEENQVRKQDENCPVYLLESPTGTGKSLSLASASLAWIHHMDRVDVTTTSESTTTNDDDDWLEAWVPPEEREQQQTTNDAKERRQVAQQRIESKLHRIRNTWKENNNADVRRRAMVGAVLAAKRAPKKRYKPQQDGNNDSKVQDFCLDEYQSDVEQETWKDHFEREDDDDHVEASDSTAVNQPPRLLLDPAARGRQLIYAARTHSQLSQFVREVARVDPTARVVHLGGRSALCGNATVTRLGTEHAINEACLDLQQGSKGKKKRKEMGSGGCSLLTARDTALPALALQMQAAPLDIEEVATIGLQTQTCAYYASREAISTAQIVCLPYSMLLSQKTRKAVGLSLQDALVVVDEAHNLPEAIRSLHASKLTATVVQAALDQLIAYTTRYADRLAGRNVLYLGQIRKILISFQKLFKKTTDRSLCSVTEFLIQRRLENINLFRVMRYLERSRLSQKLLGFTNTAPEKNQAIESNLSRHVSALSIVETFLEKLTLSGSDGKVVIEPSVSGKPATIRYVLLQPSIYLENVLQEAHALALVGGTLRPFVHMAAELLGDDALIQEAASADEALKTSSILRTRKLTAFSCGHVVPESHVLLQCWRTGPTRRTLDFRYRARTTPAVCDELGRSLLCLARTVPHGMVVFLPSYAYEAHIVQHFTSSGLWKQLAGHKTLHREPKSARGVETALRSYSTDAASDKGSLLFSVIGGKMSEGINFSDEKARCVVVVGLPYPDISDPELKEKMAALDRSNTIKGKDYVQNLCMRAVNQSVGRAIRHANDYASIILLDERYTTDSRIQNGLPPWLRRGETWKKYSSTEAKEEQLTSFYSDLKRDTTG